jgi:hypothetical protein
MPSCLVTKAERNLSHNWHIATLCGLSNQDQELCEFFHSFWLTEMPSTCSSNLRRNLGTMILAYEFDEEDS